ncbi:hypothetical protein LguiA_003075 [Lonicera macranthoides]
MQSSIAPPTAKLDEWMKQSIKGSPNTCSTSVATNPRDKGLLPTPGIPAPPSSNVIDLRGIKETNYNNQGLFKRPKVDLPRFTGEDVEG